MIKYLDFENDIEKIEKKIDELDSNEINFLKKKKN